MRAVDIPLGEWLPSRPDFRNPGCVVAENVIPTAGGYGPLPAPLGTGSAVAGACQGAKLLFGAAGDGIIVGATDSALFKIGGEVASTAGYAPGAWDFMQFNRYVIATSAGSPPQYLEDVDSDTIWSALPGSPPTSAVCARVGSFAMFGRQASAPNRIQWSGLNDPLAWTASRLTQANFADLPFAFGAVQRIVGGRFPMVFQERGVSRLEYVGPPLAFARQEIEDGRGALAPFGMATVGFLTFVLCQDGFFVTDGASFQPIGTDRVNAFFFEDVNQDAIGDTHAAVDWQNEIVAWAYKSVRSGGAFDRLMIYSWARGAWSSAEVNIARLTESVSGGMTIEDIGAAYASLEDVPGSFDDDRWSRQSRVLAAFVDGATETELHAFIGSPLAARFETGAFQPSPGRRVFVGGARLLAAGGEGATLSAAATGNLGEKIYGPFHAPGRDGFAPMRTEGREAAVAVEIPAGVSWSDAQGVQVRYTEAGAA